MQRRTCRDKDAAITNDRGLRLDGKQTSQSYQLSPQAACWKCPFVGTLGKFYFSAFDLVFR
jgi:hypothetical protein